MQALFYQMKTRKPKHEILFYEYYNIVLDNLELKLKTDLSQKCRICLQEGGTPMSNFGDGENDGNIAETIEVLACFNINSNKHDNYPKHLCDVCCKFIKALSAFRRTALQADKILSQQMKTEVNIYEPSDIVHDYSDNDTCDKDPDHILEPDNELVIKENKEKIKYTAKVTCHICNKVVNRSYIKEHVTMHDPDHKKYVCDICGRSFRLRCAYHNHSLRHRTDFPYKCQFCPYRGRYAELLKTHMRTHTGDYRYMCTECPARFIFKSNLNSHMLKHKVPKYKCDACNRAFHTELMLHRHIEADHLGIKNHVCSICGKAFGYRNAMMKHQRHVHKREKLLFGRMPAYLRVESTEQNNRE